MNETAIFYEIYISPLFDHRLLYFYIVHCAMESEQFGRCCTILNEVESQRYECEASLKMQLFTELKAMLDVCTIKPNQFFFYAKNKY